MSPEKFDFFLLSTGLGADIIDSTNQNMILFGELQEEDTWFDLSPEQKAYFDSMQHINSYLREEFHAVQNLLWKSRFISTFTELPKRYVNIVNVTKLICYYVVFFLWWVCSSLQT